MSAKYMLPAPLHPVVTRFLICDSLTPLPRKAEDMTVYEMYLTTFYNTRLTFPSYLSNTCTIEFYIQIFKYFFDLTSHTTANTVSTKYI
jgi:hypothetical protein